MHTTRKPLSLIILTILLASNLTVHPSRAATQTLGCTAPTFCVDFVVTAVSPGTTTFNAIPTGGVAPFTYSWGFGDGSNGSGSDPTHTFTSDSTYLVSLTGTSSDGQTFTVDHDVTELLSVPSSPFVAPSSSSWNTNVHCLASVTTIPGIIGTIQNSNGGADLSGAKTTSLILKHTLVYPCQSLGFSIFVELHSVEVTNGPTTTTDCSDIVGTLTCDVVGNIADFNQPAPSRYMQEFRWEIERHWAIAYDSSFIASRGLPKVGQMLDVQGFMYFSFLAPADAFHDFSGWYLELTAWRPAQSTLPPAPTPCQNADFDHDGPVSIDDLSLLALHFGSQLGQPAYGAQFDLNDDGAINVADLSIFALQYGRTC